MTEQLLDLIPQVIAVILSALTIILTAGKTKIGKAIADKFGEGLAGDALSYAASIALELVLEAMQTTTDELKKALADGKISKEEYENGLSQVKEHVLERLQELTIGKFLKAGIAKDAAHALAINNGLVESAVKKAKPVNPT